MSITMQKTQARLMSVESNQVFSECLFVAIILLHVTSLEPNLTNLSISHNPTTLPLITQAQNITTIIDCYSSLFLLVTGLSFFL